MALGRALGSLEPLPAYAAGVALAAAASVGGFALLRGGSGRSARAFLALLLGVFLGRVALVGVFGLALHALAPAHLATGLVSLVGFHFAFTVIEVVLLARVRPFGGPGGETPATG